MEEIWTCADEAAARIDRGDRLIAELLHEVGPGTEIEKNQAYSIAARMHQSAAGLAVLGDRPFEGLRAGSLT